MARAAVRPAAQVRLGRGGEPPGLISPTGVFACSRARQAPAPGSMLDPHDDTDVPSGSTDGAQMESTSSPVPREHAMAVPSITRAFPYSLGNAVRVHRCTDKGYTAFVEHLTTRPARSCQVRRAWEPFFLLATRVIP